MNLQPTNLCDYYKVDHRSQYPEGTELVFSNLTPRKSRIPEVDSMVFFGLQYFIKEYLIKQWNEKFFQRPKDEVVGAYKRRIETSLGVGAITFEHIEALHDLGYLPLEIKAVPEGTQIPMRCAALTVHNTIPEFFWLTNYIETVLSCTIWGMCTSATTALRYRKILNQYADKTVGNRDFVQWQGHDFSFRGMFGVEAACMSGAAHLLSFTGTDTIPAIDFLEEYYNANSEKELIGASVPATEHAVMCMGTMDNEIGTFQRLITEIYPKGIVSIVSDTWDFWKVITEYLPQLKSKIMSRDGKVVIRPDSGDPVKIICGYKCASVLNKDTDYLYGYDRNHGLGDIEAVYVESENSYYELEAYNLGYGFGRKLLECEVKGAIECMWDVFGGTTTAQGYKLLDSHIGLIYGDSITPERCQQICDRLEKKEFASFNVVLGIGSYTYTFATRDTYGMAVKATYGEVNGTPREIFKQPKTDDGTKNSAKGLIAVYEEDGKYVMRDQATWDDVNNCSMVTVYKDGTLKVDQSLSEIRARLADA